MKLYTTCIFSSATPGPKVKIYMQIFFLFLEQSTMQFRIPYITIYLVL
jgi:hypothetical protein